MSYLIVGLGLSGKGAANYLLAKKKKVLAFDHFHKQVDEAMLRKGLKIIEKENDIDFSQIHTLVISPGIDPHQPLVQKAKEHNIEIIGEIELALRDISNVCIGITGTNGKTTVTSLIAHVLQLCHIPTKALGNIGTSLCSTNIQKEDVIILELSSFQLETMKEKKLDAAAIINIYEDHLDRYPNFDKYIFAKCNIQNCMKEKAPLFLSQSTYDHYQNYFSYPHCTIIKEQSMDTKNKTYAENLVFAYAICQRFGVTYQQFADAFVLYQPHPHRLEFVAKINQINFYNDSKATNIEAVIRAVEKLSSNIILIAGGKNKGFAFSKWKVLKNSIKCIIAIGETKEKIKEDLQGFSVFCVSSLEEAVKKAYGIAKPDDNILLSPGCSSYDQFHNYEHRGKAFISYVHQLQKGDLIQ